MKVINWFPEDDENLKPGEMKIHNIYHANKALNVNKEAILGASKRQERIGYLEKASQLAGTELHGSVLEVGAGDGWCSGYMLLNYLIDEIFIMEVDRPAVEELIPKTLSMLGVDDRNVNYVLGSFNDIKIKDKLDFVVAMGALHHSSNLFLTLRSIFESLKPGGWLIAQEPYMVNSTRNSYYFNRDNQVINFKGMIELKNNERSDIFYRECEYQTAALHAGFNYNCHKLSEDIKDLSTPNTGSSSKKFKAYLHSLLGPNKPSVSDDSPKIERPENFVIYAQKPFETKDEHPPTSWEY